MSSARQLVQKGGFWLRRTVRVALATVLVLVIFAFVAARISYARVTDGLLDFGEELRRTSGQNINAEHQGDLYEIVLNGQPLDSANASTRHSMHEVLDYFQSQCKDNANGLSDTFANLPKSVDGLPLGKGSEGFFTVRREQENRGFVFCMAADKKLSNAEMIMRLRRAGTTGDFGLIGDVRYVTVYKEENGARVFTAWTHGTFNVYSMFPKTGDAPGEDFGGVPRPDGGRRILSATVTGAPFGANAYEVPGAPTDVAKGLDTKLVAAGWKLVPTAPGVPNDTQFYSLGNAVDVGVNARKAHGDTTHVSYIVSRGIGSVSR
jgi:hypothetical protein